MRVKNTTLQALGNKNLCQDLESTYPQLNLTPFTYSQCDKDPKKLYLLLIEASFSEETLATSLAHGSRAQTSKAGVLH